MYGPMNVNSNLHWYNLLPWINYRILLFLRYDIAVLNFWCLEYYYVEVFTFVTDMFGIMLVCISTKFCCVESVFVRLIKFYYNIQTFDNRFTWIIQPTFTKTSSIVTVLKYKHHILEATCSYPQVKTISSKKELTKMFYILVSCFLPCMYMSSPLPVT